MKKYLLGSVIVLYVALGALATINADENAKLRFLHRGFLLDSARHFQPVEDIEKNLAMLASLKFKHFHGHLSDNEGFRIPISTLPKLTPIGAHLDVTNRGQNRTSNVISFF